MLRSAWNKMLVNTARKTIETKTKSPYQNLLTFQPKQHFSGVDRFLNRLQRPLYQYLIGANLVVYLAWNSNFVSKQFLYDNFTLSLNTVNRGRFHTFFTYSISHINFMHMFFNMFTLYFFGRFTEMIFSKKTLLHLYLVGALSSAFLIHASNRQYNNNFPTVGASGATSAILAYYILNFPTQPILLFFFPVPAWMVGALLFVQSLMMYDGRGGISGSGHMGGLIGGVVYFFLTKGKGRY